MGKQYKRLFGGACFKIKKTGQAGIVLVDFAEIDGTWYSMLNSGVPDAPNIGYVRFRDVDIVGDAKDMSGQEAWGWVN